MPAPEARSQRPHRNRVTPMGDIVATPLRGTWLGNRGILHRGTDIVSFHRSALWIICTLQHKDWRLPQWQPGHFTVLFFHDEAVALAAGHRPCALCRRDAYNAFRRAAADRWRTQGAPGDSGREGGAPGRGVSGRTEKGDGGPGDGRHRDGGPGDGRPGDGKPGGGRPDERDAGASFNGGSAKELDRRLHAERVHPGTHRRRLHQHAWPDLPDGAFVLTDGAPSLVLGDALIGWSTTGYTDARTRPGSGTATVITPPTTLAALRAGYPVQIDGTATVLTRGGGQSADVTTASGPSSASEP